MDGDTELVIMDPALILRIWQLFEATGMEFGLNAKRALTDNHALEGELQAEKRVNAAQAGELAKARKYIALLEKQRLLSVWCAMTRWQVANACPCLFRHRAHKQPPSRFVSEWLPCASRGPVRPNKPSLCRNKSTKLCW